MNKEITIYELLGLIKEGQVPEVIKYKQLTYYKEFDGYYTSNELKFKLSIMNDLNDKVEIIEEDKKIEKMIYNEEYRFSKSTLKDFTYEDKRLLDSNFKELMNKINELIDEIEKLKEDK